MSRGRLPVALVAAALLAACSGPSRTAAPAPSPGLPSASPTASPSTGIPPLLDPHDVYAAGRPGLLAAETRLARPLVYVPNSKDNTVSVIDPKTYRVLKTTKTGKLPQHVTPSYDLTTLYVDNDLGNSLTRIDPRTGALGATIKVDDPYNLYFTSDGGYAVVVAEARKRLDFYDAKTFRLVQRLNVDCPGVDHMDFSADGTHALVSCEFGARMIWVDMQKRKVLSTIALMPGSMPQDVKLSPDGRTFYVADMRRGGVYLITAATRKVERFLPTGSGAHGLYPSRDSTRLYITNRTGHSISLLDFETKSLVGRWVIPGGTPDMGGLDASGKVLWLSGRYTSEVYAIDTTNGRVLARIPVGKGAHGLCVWPQPGRYSLGHTGALR